MPAPADVPGRIGAARGSGGRTAASRQSHGRMPLLDHLRELRNRLFKAVLCATIGAIVGWFLYPHVWHFIQAPVLPAAAHHGMSRGMRTPDG